MTGRKQKSRGPFYAAVVGTIVTRTSWLLCKIVPVSKETHTIFPFGGVFLVGFLDEVPYQKKRMFNQSVGFFYRCTV